MLGTRRGILLSAILGSVASAALPAGAASLLAPTDLIKAIDSDVLASASNYPGNESPQKAIDGDTVGSKYLNTGNRGSGFIVTPGASVVRSFVLTTGNDADGRDPFSYVLYGTNNAIASGDNSGGVGEAWTVIQQGKLSPPAGDPGRSQPFPVVNVNNNASFTSYKLIFPTLRNRTDPLMQVNEAQFYTAANGGGAAVLAGANPILAIDAPISESQYPDAENPQNALDGNSGTKYLNFGKANSGLIVTPGAGKSIVTGLKITTANDFPERDPVAFTIFGTNDPVQSLDNSDGLGEGWTPIFSGPLDAPTDRFTDGALTTFPNLGEYTSYKVLFTSLRNADVVDSMQVAGVQLEGTFVPEPGTIGLGGAALAGLAMRRRRRA